MFLRNCVYLLMPFFFAMFAMDGNSFSDFSSKLLLQFYNSYRKMYSEASYLSLIFVLL